MLSEFEVQLFNKCVLNVHCIVQVEINNPLPGAVSSVRITDESELSWLLDYSIKQGRDLQSLFSIGDQDYMTLFIDSENINTEFEDKLLSYGLIESYKNVSSTAITISFPEKILK